MSLNHRQIAETRQELARNPALSGLPRLDLTAALGFDATQVQAALDVAGAPPQDVWLVRDYLDHVVRSTGATPHPYTSLTDRARSAARGWFPLTNIDDVLHR